MALVLMLLLSVCRVDDEMRVETGLCCLLVVGEISKALTGASDAMTHTQWVHWADRDLEILAGPRAVKVPLEFCHFKTWGLVFPARIH